MSRYEERLAKKNDIIGKLKEELVEARAELGFLKQENNLHHRSGSREKDELRRMLDAATLKLDGSIREKDELRRQNQEYRLKNSLYAEEVERLLAEKTSYKQTLERNYCVLKE